MIEFVVEPHRDPGPSTGAGTGTVLRERLHAPDGGAGPPPRLTSVWAPAGAGKSTLLRQWANALRADGVHVEEADVRDSLATRATLDRAIAAAQVGETWLLIDNAETMFARTDAPTVAAQARAIPDRLHVVIAGRFRPAGFTLVESAIDRYRTLDQHDLAFAVDETLELAARQGISLSSDDAQHLVDRTGGWAAGLALVMPYLGAQSDVSGSIAAFRGDHHSIADYLVTRVLDSLDEAERDVLLRSCVCDVVPLDLAVELTGVCSAGAVLTRLADRNLLIRRSADGTAFLFHPVLRAYLDAEFRRRDEPGALAAHRTASRWYEDRGDVVAALHQAVSAAAAGDIVRLLEAGGVELLFRGRSRILTLALAALPLDRQTAFTRLLQLAIDFPWSANPDGARTALIEVKRMLGSEGAPRRWADYVLAADLFLEDDAHSARRRADGLRAVIAARPDSALLLQLGLGRWLFRTGEHREALDIFNRVQAHALQTRLDWLHLVACDMAAEAAAAVGDWRTAAVFDDRVSQVALKAPAFADRAAGRALLITTIRSYERMEEIALSPLHRLIGVQANADVDVDFHARAMLHVVAIDLGPNQRPAMTGLIDLLRVEGTTHPRAVSAVGVRLMDAAMRFGSPNTVRDVERIVTEILGRGSLEALTMHLLAAGGSDRPSEMELLRRLRSDPAAQHGSAVANAWLVLADLADRSGRPTETVERLLGALEVAESYGFANAFLARAGRGAQLLNAHLGSLGRERPYAQRILDRAGRAGVRLTADPTPMLTPLTPKELAILAELPAHQTVSEIAARHHLSTNTIKTHLRSLYAKLGVAARSEAVRAARERGLL